MARPKVFLLVLACSGLLLPPVRAAAVNRGQQPEVIWSTYRRDLGFLGWRPRLALGPRGEGWIGGAASLGASGGLLYRWHQGDWVRWSTSPTQAARTFVLDVDPAGALWLCDYSPTDEATYGGLRIRRYDGRRWRGQIVRPGIWPQVMDMVSPGEGWIGGNHGALLHLTQGRWRREALPLTPGERRGMNILALEMSGREEGWLAGTQGLVARYQQGRWRVVPVPEPMRREDLYALDVTADGSLWVVGSRGLIARYDGTAWRRFESPRPFGLLGLAMVSPQDGWAVGEYGTILRWDGKAWRQQPSPTLAELYSVSMTSPEEGWIAANGLILRASPRRRPWLRELAEQGRDSMARQPGRKVAAVDADGDGDLDLFSLHPASMHLYGNLGAAGFFEVPGLTPPPVSLLQGFSWGDVEGDGDLDLLVLGRVPGALWLYRNQGGPRFAAPERLPVEPLGGNDSAALADLDGDGHLDLYLARNAATGRAGNLLYRNDGAGRFARLGAATGTGGTGALTLWGDLDGDLDLDGVLPGNGGGELRLLLNEGGRLRDATAASGLAGACREGQILQGGLLDLDLDGDLDLLLLGDRLYVFLNDGRARFHPGQELFEPVASNPAVSSTLSAAGDLDHDGYPEVLLLPVVEGRLAVRLFSRGRDGRYHDVAARAGLADLTGNAAVFADWDGDGDLDLYVAGEESSHLLENLQDDASFLAIRLHGDRGNRSAVGTRVRIYEAGFLGERRFLRGHQQAGVGFNPSGVPDPGTLHFGLDARRLYDVEAVFPGGRRVVERSVRPGRSLDLYESPPGLRQAWLAKRWACRTWLTADLRREVAKLGLVVLALAVWRGLAARRFGARLLVRRWSLTAALLAIYLLTAGCLAADGRAAAQGLQILGFAGALSLVTLVDRRLTEWKSSRYLGPYRLRETLGEGGMGVVYRARDVVSGRIVALKVLHPRMTEQEEHRLRFLREARILTRLEHPNIVQVFETGEIGGRGYICMELLAGLSLRRLVRRRGPLPAEAVRAILAAACDALGYVHGRGIVHRDVKSDNLFLLEPLVALPVDEAGWRRRVRLMDFGLARSLDMNTLTGRRALLGTLAYMPPEQLRGEGLDARSDLYSLGVVAYEALTGRLPFEADDEGSLLARIQTADPVPLRRLRPEIPEALARIVEAMLARDPAQRPASAEALGELLAHLGRSGEVPAVPSEAPAAEPQRVEGIGEGPGTWRGRYEEARRLAQEGHATEAQVLMMECLAELKTTLLALDPDQRELYCRQHGVAAALDLMDRLSPQGGALG